MQEAPAKTVFVKTALAGKSVENGRTLSRMPLPSPHSLRYAYKIENYTMKTFPSMNSLIRDAIIKNTHLFSRSRARIDAITAYRPWNCVLFIIIVVMP